MEHIRCYCCYGRAVTFDGFYPFHDLYNRCEKHKDTPEEEAKSLRSNFPKEESNDGEI